MTRPYLGFDIETSGELPEYALQPWRLQQGKAWITTAAISWRNKDSGMSSAGAIAPSADWFRVVLERAIAKEMRVVTWNGTFDMTWMIALGLGDLVDRVHWLDAMLMWKHLDLTPSFYDRDHTYALKGEGGAAGQFAPSFVGYEDEVDYHDPSPEARQKLLAYNKLDTELTVIAAEEIWKRLGAKDDGYRRACVLTEAATLPLLARANLDGMRVNRPAVKALYLKLSETVHKMEQALAPHGVTEVMIRSPKKLSKKIFDDWKLTQIQGRSTAKDVLTQLVVEDDRVALLMQYREALNLRGKFIGSIVKSCEYNGDRLTRPQCVPFGTYTSRCTYNSTQGKKGTKKERHVGFPLHQMKRGKDFRSMVIAPEADDIAPEGYEIVEFDAAGQEFRWMAIASGDETMLELCQPGEDPHSFMAAQIYGGDYRAVIVAAKEKGSREGLWRQGGKVANFSLQYRTGAKTLRIRARTDHGLILSEQESVNIHQTYVRTYKRVPKYWSSQIQDGRQKGYAETFAGRRLKVMGNWSGPHGYSLEQTMINYPVQGTGGDQKYLALKILKNHLSQYDARFAWDLHDGMYFFVPKLKALKFATEMRPVLDALPYDKAWGFRSPIPLPWDAKVGPSWGELSEVKE